LYPPPEDFDSTLLAGSTIEFVSYAEYQVNLHLSNDLVLVIESGYDFNGLTDGVESVHSFPIEHSSLMRIVGDEVASVEFDRASGNMVISFKRGTSLHLTGDAGPYESYRLISKDVDIIV
jgi:hypothetical protein